MKKPPKNVRKRISISFDMPDKIGDEIYMERPLDGLEIMIVRVAPKPLTAADFVVVTGDPAGHDRGLHVSRKTDAPRRSRIVSSTFCSEETSRPIGIGQRLDAVPLASITCKPCVAKLTAMGIDTHEKGQ